jgi:cytochrome c-type biogenesis protein CcmH
MFWLITGVMLAAAVLFVALPLYRRERRFSATSVASVFVVAAIAGVLYSQIGSPGVESGRGQAQAQAGDMPDIQQMVNSLAARLQENPDDLAGWKMLWRSYLQLQNFPGAVAAFEKAVEMESGQNGQTLADLGEALLMNDQRALLGRAGQLFENALAITPDNPKALFYSGMSAVQRGDDALAAERWEALLATSPPPNVQEILRQRIAELRGESPASVTPQPAESAAGIVNVAVSLGDAAAQANLPDATVFIIARDPNQPSPPIAAVRRRLSELPATVGIGDADAMIPGRVPSGFDTLEIVARVSLSGQPVAQPGDWYGQMQVNTTSVDAVSIVIDQQVP